MIHKEFHQFLYGGNDCLGQFVDLGEKQFYWKHVWNQPVISLLTSWIFAKRDAIVCPTKYTWNLRAVTSSFFFVATDLAQDFLTFEKLYKNP